MPHHPDLTPVDLRVPIAPEMNLYLFFKEIASTLTHVQVEILEFLVAAGTARGWFPRLDQVVERFSDHEDEETLRDALDGLQRRRLLYPDADGGISSIVGGITHRKTHIRAMTADAVPFHLVSSIDALTCAPMLQKPVDVRTTCAVSGQPITFRVDPAGSLDDCEPQGVTAFVPGWDGRMPIPQALGGQGLFFAGDAPLQEWMEQHGDPEGMPLTEDTIRSVGMEMAAALAELYSRMSIR